MEHQDQNEIKGDMRADLSSCKAYKSLKSRDEGRLKYSEQYGISHAHERYGSHEE